MKYFGHYKLLTTLPCPVSKIKRVKCVCPDSAPESDYLTRLQEISEWNHVFWSKNNARFEVYLKQNLPEDASEEERMSIFQDYLEANYQEFQNYNRDWYSKNWNLSVLDAKAKLKMFINKFV